MLDRPRVHSPIIVTTHTKSQSKVLDECSEIQNSLHNLDKKAPQHFIIICCLHHFSKLWIHKAAVKIKGTPVPFEGFRQPLYLRVEEFLFDCSASCWDICNSGVALRRSTGTLLKLMVRVNICSHKRCGFLNPVFCRDLHRTSTFLYQLLEVFTTFLFENGITTVEGLCMSPTLLYSFPGELRVKVWSKLHFHSHLFPQVLKSCLFLFEIGALRK